jgi:Tfp pilus assembly PilM family ATPase
VVVPDITSPAVKLLALVDSGRGLRVESFPAEPTTAKVINETAIVDADAVGEVFGRGH